MQKARKRPRKEVADLLGISQSYISRLEKRIMKRLKKENRKNMNKDAIHTVTVNEADSNRFCL